MKRILLKTVLPATILLALLYNCTNVKKTYSKKEPQQNDVDKNRGLFEMNVRSTEALTPEEERLSFKLPEGFEIQLFASEPQIGKPMNMAFDAKGRLWITESFEYPMAAEINKGKDRISILEDKDGDGKADTFIHFDDTLNIPIGILPVKDGAIGLSIPNIYKFTDVNGDDKADNVKKLLGPFGYFDTHGMANNFTRGFDGWVHACHGNANASVVAGTDGDSISMFSGNTFRFKMDGSRVEQTTFGRVNPFGMTFDEMGFFYSSDCHSSPIYQLIPGGDYPQFGKKDDGLGFAPAMRPTGKESTAIAGLAYYTARQFPKEYQKNFYWGDVVKCKVYRNSVELKGSSPVAIDKPDFLSSTDPWFRPVDIKVGPDGAIYVADFYNRIIAHIEVALDDPRRDRIRGRIWKITYKGKDKGKDEFKKNWAVSPVEELVKALSHYDLQVRMKATEQLVDRLEKKAIEPVKTILSKKNLDEKSYAHGLWILERLNALNNETITKASANASTMVRLHTLRILSEMPSSVFANNLLINGLNDREPLVQRVAMEGLKKYPNIETVKATLAFRPNIPSYDSHLIFTSRITLRNILRNEDLLKQVLAQKWNPQDLASIADVMKGIYSKESGLFLFNFINQTQISKDSLLDILKHIAVYLPAEKNADLVSFTKNKFPNDDNAQYKVFNILQKGALQKGQQPGSVVINWGKDIAEKFTKLPISKWGYKTPDNYFQKADPIKVFTGFYGKTLLGFEFTGFVGSIISPQFNLSDSLKFFVESYEKPGDDSTKLTNNAVILHLAETDQIIASEIPRRGYRFGNVTWDVSKYKGKKAYLEIKNATTTSFTRAGNFAPDALDIPSVSPSLLSEYYVFIAQIAGNYEAHELEEYIKQSFTNPNMDYHVKLADARALLQLSQSKYAPLIAAELRRTDVPLGYQKQLINILGEFISPMTLKILEESIKGVSKDFQLEIVKALAGSDEGKSIILKQVRAGNLYTRVLLEPKVEEKMNLNISDKQQKEIKELTSNLSAIDEERENLIKERIKNFNPSEKRPPGLSIFVQNCSPCHQINGTGGLIGPQLNGIGNWGAEALTVKILDPNRNVSEAFRNYTIKLKNGNVLTGLYRREEGETLVFANMAGEEFSIPKKNIVEKKASKYTLMPDHFSKVIPEEEFYSLLSYLLSIK